MNIMELGAIGELVGGVAVIATLIYLAVQVRQSRDLALAGAQREVLAGYQTVIERVSERPELFQRGLFDFESLSNVGQVRFSGMMAQFVNHLDQMLRMHEKGLETADNVDVYGNVCLAFLGESGGHAWWVRARPMMVRQAREYLERRLAAPGQLPPPVTEVMPWFVPDDSELEGA